MHYFHSTVLQTVMQTVLQFIYDFHIFAVSYSSLRGLVWDQYNNQLPVGLLAQLAKRYTGIAEVMGSNSVRALFLLLLKYCS